MFGRIATSGCALTLSDMGFFEPSVVEGGGGMRAPHHNFVVIALMITKFGNRYQDRCILHNGNNKYKWDVESLGRHYQCNL